MLYMIWRGCSTTKDTRLRYSELAILSVRARNVLIFLENRVNSDYSDRSDVMILLLALRLRMQQLSNTRFLNKLWMQS